MTPGMIEPLGDSALLIRLGDRIDPELNARVRALASTLVSAALPGVRDIAPAYASICLRYEPRVWSGPEVSAYDRLVDAMRPLLAHAGLSDSDAGAAAVAQIPVCYGGDYGPDLDVVARHARLDRDEVIARHCSAEYRVAMLGFAPGFPYLLGLDAALHTPRRSNPRTRVPAGSIAIGGAQTGIYPRELPGGWQIIGRTPLRLFDPARDPPALLSPGQRVRFHAVAAPATDRAR